MEQTKVLETINNSALKLLESQSLEELYETIVTEAQNAVGADYGLLVLQDRDRLETVHTSSDLLKGFRPKKNGVCKKSLCSHTIEFISFSTLRNKRPELAKYGIKSCIIIPLSHRSEDLGTIILLSQKDEKYSNEVLPMLKLYSSLSSLAIIKIRSHEEITRALEIRDKFISVASHELRTPLTSLNGYIQLIYSRLQNSDSVEARWMKELYTESNRFTQLVKDLLDINRIKQGQLEFILSEVDIKNVITSVIEKFTYLNSDHEIKLKDSTGSKRAVVIGDFEKLLEMFSALLHNAVKFSNPHTEVVISLTTTARWTKIRIKDEGKGIPKKDVEKIFEGFYKTIYSNDKEGMGVGLFYARHIITHHKGEISISSKENKGTIVDVTLPNARL